MTSPDGINWTLQASADNSQDWKSVTYGNGQFVAVSYSTNDLNQVMTSPDGINWTIQTVTINYQWQSITYGNNLFLAVSSGGTMTSTDAFAPDTPTINTIIPSGFSASVSFTAPTSSGFSAITNYEYSLDNGSNWVTPSPAVTTSPLRIGGLSSGTTYPIQLRALNTVGASCASATVNTTTLVPIVPNEPTNVVATAGLNAVSIEFTVPTNDGGADITNYEYTINDGLSWTALTSITSPLNISGLTGCTNYTIKIRAVNAVGGGATSTPITVTPQNGQAADGITWTSRTAIQDNYWSSITYGNGQFVVVSGSGSAVMTSPNAITWTSRTAIQGSWYSLTYGNGQFVAVGSSVMTSPDGITWTSRTVPENTWVNSVTYGNGQFVAVGGYSGMTSPDGITWTSSNVQSYLSSVTFGNGIFVAAGFNELVTSPDGIIWTSRISSNDSLNSVTYGNGLFVVTMYNSVKTSLDGITWTDRAAVQGNWSSITYGNNQFVAVSDDGVMTNSATISPSQPVINSITPTINSASLAFSTPENSGTSAISNYEYSLDNGNTWITPSPAIITSPILISGLESSTNYPIQLRAVNDAGTSCASLMVNVRTLSLAPTASDQTFCSGKTVADLQANGSNLKWYETETGGAALSSTTVITTGNYYVSQTVSGNESDRVGVIVTITPSTSNTTAAIGCDSYTWSVNGQTYTDSGTYTSVVGCHTEILNLTLANTSIFRPSMAITTYGDVNSPGGENHSNIIDNDVNTKFLDFISNDGMGFSVDLGGVSKIATSISITTANDAEDRDPKNYEVLGSNDGTNFTSIATGEIVCIPNRYYIRKYDFINNTAYSHYRINFTNTCNVGNDFQLAEVQLYTTSANGVSGPIVFTTQPVNTSICNKVGVINLTASIAPISGATYQWKVQTATGTTWENANNSSVHYSGATTPVLNIQQATALMNNNKYKLVVTAPTSCTSVVTSDICVLNVNPIPTLALISGAGTICENSAKTLRISNWRTGTIQTIQWQASNVDATTGFTDIEGATGSIFTTDALTATAFYRAIITSGVCDSKTSLAVAVTVIPAPVAGIINGGNVTVCTYATSGLDLSGTSVPFSNNTLLSVAGTMGAILWQKSTNYENATGATPVWTSAGSTTNTFTASALTVDTWYRVLVSNSACSVVSTPVKITVTKTAIAGSITSASSVCRGGDITFTSSAYTGTSIQWEVSSTSATTGFTPIADANQLSFTMNAVAYAQLSKFYVRSVVTSGNCSLSRSAVKTITVSPQSVAGTVTGGGTICPGASGTVKVTGYTGAIQWQSSTDGISYVNVSSSTTSATYSANNITANTYFRAKITSGICSEVYSNAVQFTIGTADAGTLTAANETVCKGTGTTLTLNQSVGTIKWFRSTNWSAVTPTWSAVTSSSSTLLTGNLTISTAFKAVVTIGICSTETSQVVPVIVIAAPLAKTIIANVTSPTGVSPTLAICNTSTSKVLTIGAGSVGAIQWQRSSTSSTSGFVDIADATAPSYTVTNPTVGANYFRAKFTNSCGTSVFGTAFRVYYKECTPTKAITSSEFGKTPFAVVSHPNPFTSNFNLDVTTSSSEKVEVLVYDMIGRLLEKHQENVSEINTLEIGSNYPAGVYNVVVTQGKKVKTLRVIKK